MLSSTWIRVLLKSCSENGHWSGAAGFAEHEPGAVHILQGAESPYAVIVCSALQACT